MRVCVCVCECERVSVCVRKCVRVCVCHKICMCVCHECALDKNCVCLRALFGQNSSGGLHHGVISCVCVCGMCFVG